jgi:hypothetical protein
MSRMDGGDGTGELESIVAEVFAGLIERGEVDIAPGEGGAGLEIQADQWTLAIEGSPSPVAFLAIDEEPADVAEMSGALDAAVEPDDLAALRELNRRLDGGLRVALQASRDMLSMELATLLAEEPGSAT